MTEPICKAGRGRASVGQSKGIRNGFTGIDELARATPFRLHVDDRVFRRPTADCTESDRCCGVE